MQQLSTIMPLYNRVHDFVAKKPGAARKIRMAFDCSSLLNGAPIIRQTKRISLSTGIHTIWESSINFPKKMRLVFGRRRQENHEGVLRL